MTTPTTHSEPSTEQRDKDLPLLIPVPRAATMLGISRASAYRLAASGELPSRRLGGRVYVITAAVHSLGKPE
jgi:excisionase family DNA binding protein